MTATLYILGLLIRHGSMHGYQIKQIIDEHISDFAKIKTGNIYYHLNSMNKKDLVSSEILHGKKSIDKTVYTITDSGNELFHKLLKDAANEITYFEFTFDSILFFREHIDKDALNKIINNKINILANIVNGMKKHQANVSNNIKDENEFFANAIFEHHLCHYEAELNFYKKINKEFISQ